MSATDGKVQGQKINILNEKNVILCGQKRFKLCNNFK